MTVGENIGGYLEANGIKQTFLASKTGLSDACVSAIINKGRTISVTEYYRICVALNVPFDTFLNGVEEAVQS